MLIFLVVRQSAIAKTAYRRKSSSGLAECEHPPRCGSSVASSRRNCKSRNKRADVFKPKRELEKASRKWDETVATQSLVSVTCFLHQGSTSQRFHNHPKQHHHQKSSTQISEIMEDTSIFKKTHQDVPISYPPEMLCQVARTINFHTRCF